MSAHDGSLLAQRQYWRSLATIKGRFKAEETVGECGEAHDGGGVTGLERDHHTTWRLLLSTDVLRRTEAEKSRKKTRKEAEAMLKELCSLILDHSGLSWADCDYNK